MSAYVGATPKVQCVTAVCPYITINHTPATSPAKVSEEDLHLVFYSTIVS